MTQAIYPQTSMNCNCIIFYGFPKEWKMVGLRCMAWLGIRRKRAVEEEILFLRAIQNFGLTGFSFLGKVQTNIYMYIYILEYA